MLALGEMWLEAIGAVERGFEVLALGEGRPEVPSGAVLACNFTAEPIELITSLPWPPCSVCRGWGQQAWQGLSAAVLTLRSKAGAGISERSVVVSHTPRAFPRGLGSVLVFGL